MTPQDIDSMPAGPAMDALVEASVFERGNRRREEFAPSSTVAWRETVTVDKTGLPPYSTSDAAALEVLKKLFSANIYWFNQESPNAVTVTTGEFGNETVAYGPTIALAICRVALKAQNDGLLD